MLRRLRTICHRFLASALFKTLEYNLKVLSDSGTSWPALDSIIVRALFLSLSVVNREAPKRIGGDFGSASISFEGADAIKLSIILARLSAVVGVLTKNPRPLLCREELSEDFFKNLPDFYLSCDRRFWWCGGHLVSLILGCPWKWGLWG